MKRRAKNTRGAALLYALGLMMILSLGLAASWRYLVAASDHAAHQRHAEEARRLAESGAYHALGLLAAHGGDAQDVPLTPLAGGAYAVTLESRNGYYTLHASGYLGERPPWRAAHAIEVDAMLDASGPRILRWEEARP